MKREQSPMKISDLMAKLQKLPANAEVWCSTWCSDRPLSEDDAVLLVYEKDGETRLYFDDGEAQHPELDPYWKNLLNDERFKS